MIRLCLYLWENYGLDALQLGIICFFGWKILTNHLKHLQDDVSVIKTSVDSLKERVSKIEGKLSK